MGVVWVRMLVEGLFPSPPPSTLLPAAVKSPASPWPQPPELTAGLSCTWAGSEARSDKAAAEGRAGS